MKRQRSGEQGFMLVALMVTCFLILLALSVAAPRIAKQLQREREEATVQRAHQYTRAIRLYYRKFGHYPSSIDQLEKTNNIRFLRQRYLDPLTGKDDWRIIHVGENKTQVKGFFGEPLTGLPTAGPGGSSMGSSSIGSSSIGSSSVGSSTSSTGGGGGLAGFGAALLGGSSGVTTGSSGATGATGTSAANGTAPTDPFATQTGAAGATGTTGAPGSTGTTGSTGTSGTGSGLGSGGGPIMGFGLAHQGESIVVVNDQTSYDTWEFLYDPRSEPKPNLNGVGSGSAGSLGGNNTTNPITGSGSAFGSSSTGSGFGGTTGSTGSSGTTGSTGSSGSTGGTTNGSGATQF